MTEKKRQQSKQNKSTPQGKLKTSVPISPNDTIENKPDKPCYICGSMKWWLPKGDWFIGRKQWICGCCHPPPNKDIIE